MATTLARPWILSDTQTANFVVESIQTAPLDDVVAMAMLAILSAVYLVRGTLWDRPDPHLYKMYERPQEQMGSNSVAPVSRDVAERMQQIVSLQLAVIFAAVANVTSRAQILSYSGALNQALQNVLLADWLRRSNNVMASLPSWQTRPILSRTQSPASQSPRWRSSSCRHLVRVIPATTYTTSGAGSIQSAANH
jgi:hypothetical protein